MIKTLRIGLPGIFPSARSLWEAAAGSPWRGWLESGGPASVGRYRAMAWGTPRWVFRGSSRGLEISTDRGGTKFYKDQDPIPLLRGLLKRSFPNPAGHSFLRGGAFGYWGYECARHFEKIAFAPSPRTGVPEFLWVLPRFWAVWDRRKNSFSLLEQAAVGETAEMGKWRALIKKLPREKAEVKKELARSKALPLDGNRAWYESRVRKIKKYIAAGDIYQANLTHRLDFPWPDGRGPVDLFDALRALNPSPYSFLLQGREFSLASCSPELLLRADGDRVETRPIAGTRPRGKSSAEDRRLSGELLLHPKERAEHVMLLDLERNDLGRVCRPGSVQVSERLVLEKYSHVAHIVSHVRGRLRRGLDGLDATRAVFPGGTITGCPKVRCMEILNEIESEPRGPFFGGAGWIGPSGDTVLNILIRTALVRRGRMTLRVGAGIVADSDPAREYDETLHKAAALLSAFRRIGGSI